MANRKESKVVQEEIKRLKSLKHSQRKVCKLLGIHRDTVRKYWDLDPQGPVVQDPKWSQGVDWVEVAKEVNQKVPKKILYEELDGTHDLASYSTFCRFINNKIGETKTSEVVIRITRIPGESLEVDYSGDSIDILSPATGEILKTQLFVSAMSCSGKVYAEFTFSQRLEDWIESHCNMFEFYGGVVRFEIVDNLKSGVNKSDRYDPELNRTFNDMISHYGLAVDPADPASPRHKPNVEKAVDILQSDFFPRVRKTTFTSLYDLNKELRQYLIQLNSRPMKETGLSRDQLFEKEKSLLKALPENRYEIFHFKKAKVHPDCHVQVEGNFYSVPHRYVGKTVEVKCNQKIVHIYFEAEHLAVHKKACGKGRYVTNPSHYPERKYVEQQIVVQYLFKKALEIGPQTNDLIKVLFNQPKFPLKNLRKIQAVLGLSGKATREAMEYASECSLSQNKYHYRYIKRCIEFFPKTQRKKEIVNQTPKRQLSLICLQGGQNE